MITYPITVETSNTRLGNKDFFKYVVAFSYGDGSLRKKNTEALYRTAQIKVHEDYVWWQADILASLTAVRLREYQPATGKLQIHLETRLHPKYTTIYDRMYINGIKVIDPHYLTLLDLETLAIWYMDDGCLAKRHNKEYNRLDYNIVICTENFSYGDNYLIARAIKEKTGYLFDVVKQKVNGNLRYRLRLNKRQTPFFLESIRKFVLPSFEYKLQLSDD